MKINQKILIIIDKGTLPKIIAIPQIEKMIEIKILKKFQIIPTMQTLQIQLFIIFIILAHFLFINPLCLDYSNNLRLSFAS